MRELQPIPAIKFVISNPEKIDSYFTTDCKLINKDGVIVDSIATPLNNLIHNMHVAYSLIDRQNYECSLKNNELEYLAYSLCCEVQSTLTAVVNSGATDEDTNSVIVRLAIWLPAIIYALSDYQIKDGVITLSNRDGQKLLRGLANIYHSSNAPFAYSTQFEKAKNSMSLNTALFASGIGESLDFLATATDKVSE